MRELKAGLGFYLRFVNYAPLSGFLPPTSAEDSYRMREMHRGKCFGVLL